MIIKIVLASLVCIVYFVYTIRYLLFFNRSNYFTGRLKVFHILMIWLVPFLWIILLKNLFKPTPGSYKYLDNKEPDSLTESSLGIWIDQSTGTDNNY
jgi:hypothetical protein